MTFKPEFSRPVPLTDIPPKGLEMNVSASADERQKLCQRFDLLGIESLSAHLRLFPAGDLFRLEGRLRAEVVQACVVTLEPVPSLVEAEFSRLYGDVQALAEAVQALDREVDIDLEAEDLPDPVENGAIDAGEAVAEELALSLEPFPRKPGASLENTPWAAQEEEGKPHPFAPLSKLRDKLYKKV